MLPDVVGYAIVSTRAKAFYATTIDMPHGKAAHLPILMAKSFIYGCLAMAHDEESIKIWTGPRNVASKR
jgi:hypothetical protein